jgi:plastocyanin
MNMAAPAAAAGTEVLIKDFMFEPMSLKIKAGDRIKWTNKDEEPHTVVSDTGAFRSSALDSDETFSFQFDKPGTYHFTCSIHPRMVGTIVVE